jgi:thiamine-phosphate diphosphorylase
MLARMHVVTDDAVLAAPEFASRAHAVLAAGRDAIALHVRGHHTPGARLYRAATALREPARASHARLFLNDRIDVALACGADGLQLGRASLPVPDARTLFGASGIIGYSAHTVDEAAGAIAAGADFVMVGSIWATRSHPGAAPAGPAMLREAVSTAGAPVVAIGGVTPERVGDVRAAGAWGVAVVSGVWGAADPAAAVAAYLAALE